MAIPDGVAGQHAEEAGQQQCAGEECEGARGRDRGDEGRRHLGLGFGPGLGSGLGLGLVLGLGL
eukprot:scaffold71589_cov18-Phaeocystis_antarctica.AAC.1